ncbi:hypothetical protein A5753_13055 [Mycobacterium sp. 852002-51971_SCH5477799-a]|nr:hypothetical protein A5753_13055 [Mycobacterium sp. 852002-51971_SCH5477799-a]
MIAAAGDPKIADRFECVYAVLRECHGAFALLLFLAFTAHMTAVLFHTLVLCDRLLRPHGAVALKLGSQTDAETEIAVDDLSAEARSGRI